jgi:hypothetical protein
LAAERPHLTVESIASGRGIEAAADDDGCGASGPEVPAAVLAALDATLGPSLFAAPAAAKKVEAAPAPKKAEAAPASAAASASAGEFKPVMLSGTRYLVNLANGHSYLRLPDGGQGEWAGIFSKTPKPHIDDTVPEPGAEDRMLPVGVRLFPGDDRVLDRH